MKRVIQAALILVAVAFHVHVAYAGWGDWDSSRYADISSLELSENVETLTGSKTLVATDRVVQKLDPGGSDRDVTLPAEAGSTDLVFIIYNTADGDEDLTVKNDAPATLGTLAPEEGAIFTCDGTTWTGIKMYPDGGPMVVNGNTNATSFSDADIDDVGDIALDSITADGGSSVTVNDDLHIGADDAIESAEIHDAGTLKLWDDSDDTSFTLGPVADGTTVLGATGTFNPTALQESGNNVPNATDHLGFFAATTSAQLLGVLSDETGTGAAVFGTQPTFTTDITVPTIYGSAASGGTLTLNSTSHATKGNIYFGSSSGLIYDEVNDRLGHGYAPTEEFMWAEPNGFDYALEAYDTGNTITDAVALRIRKNANATMGQWSTTADGEFAGRIIWEGVNLSANAWLPGVVMYARQEAPATNAGVPMRLCVDMYSTTSITSDAFCLNNSGGGGMNTGGVPRYVWDVRPTAGAGSIGVSGDGSSDASLFFADNTTDEWEVKREETGNLFQIWETGVANWFQITPTTGVVNIPGSLTEAGNAVPNVTDNLSVFAATTSAQLLGVLSDPTGTGSAVFNTSPSLVTPDLGTPSAATLTNATGLPISTGVSGLGANVATFLATPSSANLASAVTDPTGSGAAVFGTQPTFTTSINVGADDAIAHAYVHDAGTVVMYDDSDDTTVTMGPVQDGTTTLTFTGSLDVSGTIDGQTTINLETDATITVAGNSALYVNNDDDAVEFDLPADPTGSCFCFRNRYAQAITIDPNGTDIITMTDTAAAAGEAIVSTGAADEYICLVGVDTSNWLGLGKVGTWNEEVP